MLRHSAGIWALARRRRVLSRAQKPDDAGANRQFAQSATTSTKAMRLLSGKAASAMATGTAVRVPCYFASTAFSLSTLARMVDS